MLFSRIFLTFLFHPRVFVSTPSSVKTAAVPTAALAIITFFCLFLFCLLYYLCFETPFGALLLLYYPVLSQMYLVFVQHYKMAYSDILMSIRLWYLVVLMPAGLFFQPCCLHKCNYCIYVSKQKVYKNCS